jgi:hypothetical protein
MVPNTVAPAAGSTKTQAECDASPVATKAHWAETMGMYKYIDVVDRSKVQLALRPNTLAAQAPNDPSDPHNSNAVGKMTPSPGADDFCAVSDISEATVKVPADSADPTSTTDAPPKLAISYKYESFSVYTRPDAPGTQAKGVVVFTQDGCSAKYNVAAMYPAVACAADADCGEGSGINEAFDVKCDTAVKRCVPAQDIPSFKP